MIDRLLGRRDLVLQLALGAIALGFVLIGLGWLGAARKDTVPEQFPYLLSGGLIGLGLIFVGAALLVIRAVGQSREPSPDELRLGQPMTTTGRAESRNGGGSSRAGATVLVGASSYHRPSCRLVKQRDAAEAVPLEVAKASDLSPCRVCRPES